MNDRELFESLDRRAASATAALDARVAAVDAPDLPTVARRSVLRRRAPVALVAALALVVVAAVASLPGDDDARTTLAGGQGATHLVLPDPVAAGFEVTVAFDGVRRPGGPQGLDARVTVQGPVDAEDPWTGGVVEYSLPTGTTTLSGSVVDIGGPDARLDASGVGPTIAWVDGDVVRFLVSTRLTAEEVTALARDVIAEGTAAGAVLPGHEVLFTGGTADVFPILAAGASAPAGISGVAHRSTTGGEGLVIGTVQGSQARWQAAYALATEVEERTVRGNDAVVATFGLGLSEISWLEDDGTLVRVDPIAGDAADLAPIVEKLVEVDHEAFADLVRETSTAEGGVGSGPTEPGTPQSRDDDGSEEPAGQPLAEVGLGDDTLGSMRATVVEDSAGTLTLETSIETPGSASGTATPLVDLRSNVGRREIVGGDGPVLVAGLIGPSVVRVEVRDAVTGDPVEGEGPSTATLGGSDHVLFMGRIGSTWADVPLLAVGTTADGTEVEVPL